MKGTRDYEENDREREAFFLNWGSELGLGFRQRANCAKSEVEGELGFFSALETELFFNTRQFFFLKVSASFVIRSKTKTRLFRLNSNFNSFKKNLVKLKKLTFIFKKYKYKNHEYKSNSALNYLATINICVTCGDFV